MDDAPPDGGQAERIAAMRREDGRLVEEIFRAYGAGLDDFDRDQLLDLFQFPCVIWQFGKGHVFEDEDELAENVDALLTVFEREGIHQSVPTVKEVAVTGARAVAEVDWTHLDAAGEEVFAFSIGYFLVKESGEWFIATVINDEPDRPAPLPPIPEPPSA